MQARAVLYSTRVTVHSTHIHTDSQRGTLIEGSKIQPRELSRTHSSPALTDFLSLILARLFVRALNAASCAICYTQESASLVKCFIGLVSNC